MKEVLFYRCELCKGVISHWDIQTHGGCPKCGQRRMRPTNLTIIEKIVQIVKHPKIWEWGDV